MSSQTGAFRGRRKPGECGVTEPEAGAGPRRRRAAPKQPWHRRVLSSFTTSADAEAGAAERPSARPADGAASAHRRGARRKAAEPTAIARVTVRLTPYARRLKPEYPRPGLDGWRRWMPSVRQWLGICLVSLGLSGTFLAVAYAATDIPDNLNTYATQQDNVYFWADGTPMARTGWVRRQAMPLKDIPEDVRWAVLAAENASFYSDPGISVSGIGRALWRTVGEGTRRAGPPSPSST
ncbi:hypothetical protein SAV14893_069050 [Streptomyces avermitilis]|uniref:Glycosyl transferase family 51 domain-containing protein n=1 Tax=Streptomyces avermitilis TaxID=33903 RepID=A0A4D4M6J8_STRAX|nr:hypothetical protein SAV14893_069050 [Streptomyces avermitilis]